LQTNYAQIKKRKYKEHIKYSKLDEEMRQENTQDSADAQNFLIYVGVKNEWIKSSGRDNAIYISDLLVAFKNFIKP